METRDRQYGVENFNTEPVKNEDIDIYVNIKQTHSSSPTQSEIDLAVRRSVDEELALSEDSDDEEGTECPSQSNEIKISSSFIPIKNSSELETRSHGLASSNQKDGSISIESKTPEDSDSDDSGTDVEQHVPPSSSHLSDDEEEDSEDDLRLNQIINEHSLSKNTTQKESPLPINHMMLNNGHLKRSRSSSASSYASDSTDVDEVVSYSSEESDSSTCSSPLTCPYCEQAFRTTSEFRKHIRSHTDERPHVCKHCSKCFAQPAQLRRHLLTHTKPRAVKAEETRDRYECPHCDRVYDHKMKLLGHMSAHNKKEPSTKKKVKFQCDFCQKMFDSQRRYKVHYAAHKNGNLHCCEVCGRSFKMKSYLIVHERTHTQNKVYTGDRPFACKVCGKAFLSSSNLELHSTIHKYEKTSFPCEVCGKEFSRQSNYLAHARAHHS